VGRRAIAIDHLSSTPQAKYDEECFLLVALIGLTAVIKMAARTSTEDHLISSPSGGHVEFQVEGTGPAVLMIPSLGRGASDFDDLSRRLAAVGFTAVRLEPRGIGNSAGPMNNITLHDLAADAAAVIEAIGGKPVMVIGHAFGQRVGRTLAADRPELVKGMIMIAAGGKAPMKRGALEALLGSFRLNQSEEKRMDDVKLAFFAPGNDPNVWRDGWYPDVAKVQFAAAQATPVEAWWNAGSGIPLLVIQGLQDAVAPPENGRMMKAEMGDRVELIEIEGAGHAMLPEQPEKIAEAIVTFAHKHQETRVN
jgi:pimeloyl-ACP methyl ester carboxylesterase